MNSRKLITTLVLATALGVSGQIVKAHAQNLSLLDMSAESFEDLDISVPSVTIRNIPASLQGKRVSIFYVSGRECTIAMEGRQLKSNSVSQIYDTDPMSLRSLQTAQINAGQVTFPGIKILREGFGVANYIVIVVQDPSSPAAFLRNADGSCPTDARLRRRGCTAPADSYVHEASAFLPLDQVTRQKAASGAVIDFNQMLR